jgi:hypothetical protein
MQWEQHFGTRRGVLISQDVLISQGCYSQVSLYFVKPSSDKTMDREVGEGLVGTK